MATSDALIVEQDWIGEHFFTTDAKKGSFTEFVTMRRKAWDEVDSDDDAQSVRARFLAERVMLETTLAGLFAGEADADDASLHDTDVLVPLYEQLREILGFTDPQYRETRNGPVRMYCSSASTSADVAWVDAAAFDATEDLLAKHAETLLTPWQPSEDADEITSASACVSALVQLADPPKFVIVASGGRLLVTDHERWPEGRYLLVDLQIVAERNDSKRGGEVDRALACVAAGSFIADASAEVWWASVLEASTKHAVGVSEDLRHGVRDSIDIIGNDVVRRRRLAGLPPLPDDQANVLARQALRYLYRILFVLYAEASPHLGVLPVGTPEYQAGYSVDRLRELTIVELTTQSSQQGTHFYDSLNRLFQLIDNGHRENVSTDTDSTDALTRIADNALVFRSLKADLFSPAATSHIDEVGLSNEALQQVLQKLLLSKEQRGKDRGFISYTELGINQLGAVYEGLMSYTGYFASEDLYEVAKDGDASKGSWLVGTEFVRRDTEAGTDWSAWFVTRTDERTGESVPVVHKQGAFVFRLSGRERQQSASYYTPEVLTKFTVGQALDEMLGENNEKATAEQVLHMSVCEPALGSGAFALEAVRQLAKRYLDLAQAEQGSKIDPDQMAAEMQKVKAYIALHNVYGVDLNATAVELAEISLWLDTMVPGLQAPWFGLRLRRGNSLIGARRAVYSDEAVKDKAYLAEEPKRIPLTYEESPEITGKAGSGIFQFLLPGAGWGAATGAKEAKKLAPEGLKRVKQWQKEVRKKPTAAQIKRLRALSARVETLWQFALRRMEIAEEQSRRAIDVWGMMDAQNSGAVTRAQIETYLNDESGALGRLRLIMDAWCALWFWPLTTETEAPSIDRWLDACEKIVGPPGKQALSSSGEQGSLHEVTDWAELDTAEQFDLIGATKIKDVLATDNFAWLATCREIAKTQGFFHWELDFAAVFARSGGFDLQVGNPPWVRPTLDLDAVRAESDPWWKLSHKPTEDERNERLTRGASSLPVIRQASEIESNGAFISSPATYPSLAGLQPDLYRCFMVQSWSNSSSTGLTALIHPESHFTEERSGVLRRETYARLRRHWQFINELRLYEIHNLVTYGVHIYSAERRPSFIQAIGLFHPSTVTCSLKHDGAGVAPGIKDEAGRWDVRGHRDRIITVESDLLEAWSDVQGAESNSASPKMLYANSSALNAMVSKAIKAGRLARLDLEFSSGWHEKSDRSAGRFVTAWGSTRWEDAILQGPHLFPNLPFYKSPNETNKSNKDWSLVDLETLAPDAQPVTAYKPAGDRKVYDESYTHWGEHKQIPARDHYRIAWRCMAANTGERTLIPAIIPPGAAHVDGLYSLGLTDGSPLRLVDTQGMLGSILADFLVRVAPKSTIRSNAVQRLPAPPTEHPLSPALRLRVLRLNCLTDAYADLWRACWDEAYREQKWTGVSGRVYVPPLGDVGPEWTPDTPLRRDADRRAAQVEIDAIVAIMLGISADELCTVYRTQFPVLYGYDKNKYIFDRNGRIVPNEVLKVWRKKGENDAGDSLTADDRTATHPAGTTYAYELPFTPYNRQSDLTRASVCLRAPSGSNPMGTE